MQQKLEELRIFTVLNKPFDYPQLLFAIEQELGQEHTRFADEESRIIIQKDDC